MEDDEESMVERNLEDEGGPPSIPEPPIPPPAPHPPQESEVPSITLDEVPTLPRQFSDEDDEAEEQKPAQDQTGESVTSPPKESIESGTGTGSADQGDGDHSQGSGESEGPDDVGIADDDDSAGGDEMEELNGGAAEVCSIKTVEEVKPGQIPSRQASDERALNVEETAAGLSEAITSEAAREASKQPQQQPPGLGSASNPGSLKSPDEDEEMDLK